MCVYINEITNVVNDFVTGNKLFTAFDVTMAVRNKMRGQGVNVQHHEVKKEVHNMFDSGSLFGYNRTLANLPNVNPQPWVYHPLSVDPSTYNGQPVASSPSVSSPPSSLSSNGSTDDDDDEDDPAKVYKFDRTNRLCVPNNLTRQAGFKSGDQVGIYKDPIKNELVITKDDLSTQMTKVTSLLVDGSDNVRIRLGTMLKGGLGGVAYQINGDGNGVKVTRYA